MTKTIRLLTAIVLTVAVRCGPAMCAPPRFSLSISVPQSVVKAGSDITVKIVLKNVTDQDLRFVRTMGGPFLYRGTVRDENGNSVPYTEFGDRTWGQNRGPFTEPGVAIVEMVEAPQSCTPQGRYSHSNPPLERYGPFFGTADIEAANRDCGLLRHEIVLSQIFDLTKPGKYIIQLQRNDEESKTLVKSNTITVSITP